MTRLAPGLPKGDGNGLDQLSRKLIDEPHRVRVVIALIDTKKLATDVDTGDVEPTEGRRRWRALMLAIKAKLEVVETGISTFEAEFLPHTVMPDGRTVADHILPRVEQAIAAGTMPNKGLLAITGGEL